MKYHVKKNGEPGVCTAQEGNCPFGSDAPHFDDKDSAWRHAMESLRNEYGDIPSVEKARTPDVYEESREKYNEIFTSTVVERELTRTAAVELALTVARSMREDLNPTRDAAVEGALAVARSMREDLNLDSPNMMRADENPNGSKAALFSHEISVTSAARNLQSDDVSEEGKDLIMEELRTNGVSDPAALADLRYVARSTLPYLTRKKRLAQSEAQVAFARRRGVSDAAKILREAHSNYSAVKPSVLIDKSLDVLPTRELARTLSLPWRG